MLLISRKCVVRCIGTRYLPVPRIDEIHIDWRVLSFAAVVSMLTQSSFGLIPIRGNIKDRYSRRDQPGRFAWQRRRRNIAHGSIGRCHISRRDCRFRILTAMAVIIESQFGWLPRDVSFMSSSASAPWASFAGLNLERLCAPENGKGSHLIRDVTPWLYPAPLHQRRAFRYDVCPLTSWRAS